MLHVKQPYFFKHCALYEAMCHNVLYPDMSQMTVWRMCIAYRPKKGSIYTQNI